MSQDYAKERRKFYRVNLDKPVRYEFKDPHHFGGCLSCDIGDGGIRVSINDFIPLNTELNLKIHLPYNRVVDRKGRVVWVEKFRFADRYQAGIEFETEKGNNSF